MTGVQTCALPISGSTMEKSILECMGELKGMLLQGMSDLQTSFGAQLSKQSGEIHRLSERSERAEDFMSIGRASCRERV